MVLSAASRYTLFPYTTLFRSILASLLVRLVVLLPFQLLRLSLATPSRWTPLITGVVRSHERFSRNAETELVSRRLLEKRDPVLPAETYQNRDTCFRTTHGPHQ